MLTPKKITAKVAAFSLILGTLLVPLYQPSAHPGSPKKILPETLTDVDGHKVDVAKLAATKRLFFVTLKATWCPVCFNQLLRLKKNLSKLKICGASFVVLSPGPKDALKAVKARSEFPYPFVEDVGLTLARKLDLVLAPNQIRPVIVGVNKRREIVWMQYGRNGRYYGDKELQAYLDCEFDIASN
ncbi:MAG: redoxin domain-containing protein, partial [bacterium]